MQQPRPAPFSALVVLCLAAPVASLWLSGQVVAATPQRPAAPGSTWGEVALARAPEARPAAVSGKGADQAKLGLKPGRLVARVGEQFTVSVYVRDAEEIVSVPFTLSYDPEVVAVIAVELAPGWEPGQRPTLMYESRDDGDLVVGLSLIGDDAEALRGRQRLVRVRLIGLRVGETKLEFRRSALIRPGLGQQPAKLRDASIRVRP